jgi:hypothetical protein
MAEQKGGRIDLWTFIVSCGLEEEFERNWMGLVTHKRTRLVLRADMTPELVQTIAGAKDLVADARRGAASAVSSARQAVVNRLLANARKPSDETES